MEAIIVLKHLLKSFTILNKTIAIVSEREEQRDRGREERKSTVTHYPIIGDKYVIRTNNYTLRSKSSSIKTCRIIVLSFLLLFPFCGMISMELVYFGQWCLLPSPSAFLFSSSLLDSFSLYSVCQYGQQPRNPKKSLGSLHTIC